MAQDILRRGKISEGRNELTDSRKLWETKRDGGKEGAGPAGTKEEKEEDKNLLEKKGTERAKRREPGTRQRGGVDKGRQRKGGGGGSKRNKL